MTRAFISATILILMSSFNGLGQQVDHQPNLPVEIHNLKIKGKNGDSIMLSTDKRLIILDYWSEGCVICIQSFPKIEKLNEQFNGRAVIVPVLHGDKHIFERIRSTSKIVQEAKLPFVIGDTILTKQFRHKFVPYYVWIYEDKVIGTSQGTLLSSDVIERVLSNKQKSLTDIVKLASNTAELNDTIASILRSATLENRTYNGISYQSSIQKMKPEDYYRFGGKRDVRDNSDPLTSIRVGFDPSSLLEAAGIHLDKILIKEGAPINLAPRISGLSLEEWRSQNAYWYKIRLESADVVNSNFQQFLDIVRNDVSDAFGIELTTDTVKRNCIVLKCTDSIKLKKRLTSSPPDMYPFYERTKTGMFVKGCQPRTILSFISIYLNRSLDKDLPFVDETGIEQAFDFYIPWDESNDITSLNKSLKGIGLELEITAREQETIVITKKNSVIVSQNTPKITSHSPLPSKH